MCIIECIIRSCPKNPKKAGSQVEVSQALLEPSQEQILSAEDQIISDDYLRLSLNYEYPTHEAYQNQYKSFIARATQIKNKQEREYILMDIYQKTAMYQQAFELMS